MAPASRPMRWEMDDQVACCRSPERPAAAEPTRGPVRHSIDAPFSLVSILCPCLPSVNRRSAAGGRAEPVRPNETRHDCLVRPPDVARNRLGRERGPQLEEPGPQLSRWSGVDRPRHAEPADGPTDDHPVPLHGPGRRALGRLGRAEQVYRGAEPDRNRAKDYRGFTSRVRTRPPRRSIATGTTSSPSTTSRPSTGCTCARATRSSRSSPGCGRGRTWPSAPGSARTPFTETPEGCEPVCRSCTFHGSSVVRQGRSSTRSLALIRPT